MKMLKKVKTILAITTLVPIILGALSLTPLGISYFIGYGSMATLFIINGVGCKNNFDKTMFYGYLAVGIVDIIVAFYFLLCK